MRKRDEPLSTKDLDKIAKAQAKEEKQRKGLVDAHHRNLAKNGSGARWRS